MKETEKDLAIFYILKEIEFVITAMCCFFGTHTLLSICHFLKIFLKKKEIIENQNKTRTNNNTPIANFKIIM